ncbi:MarR family winged helix-turn-helix transcriptional regulator [Gilvimarinus polysaccharolyticus]|uniref:MarR family winged helix-turn-helix transcriptional regulator n=1 Tax=Gilvimarinus polysaccharolyticus TaxID=863921 RepID=UPI0006732846|nr:MarR family transcriptional regulator [Gilvimarinus polysaccharolyticus]
MFNAISIEATFYLAHAIKQQLGSQLEAHQLGIAPMHVRVLKIIHKRKSCTAIDIANLFKRDKAQITRLLKGLIDQGLVKKESNPEDKRSQLLVLTPQGKALQEDLLSISEQMQKQMTQDIDEKDLDVFIKVAQTMTKNLANT